MTLPSTVNYDHFLENKNKVKDILKQCKNNNTYVIIPKDYDIGIFYMEVFTMLFDTFDEVLDFLNLIQYDFSTCPQSSAVFTWFIGTPYFTISEQQADKFAKVYMKWYGDLAVDREISLSHHHYTTVMDILDCDAYFESRENFDVIRKAFEANGFKKSRETDIGALRRNYENADDYKKMPIKEYLDEYSSYLVIP